MSKQNLMSLLREDGEHVSWKRLAREDRKVDSIRELRSRHESFHGYISSLKDTKDVVEEYVYAESRKPQTKHTSTLKNGEVRIFQTTNGSFTVEVVKVMHGLSMEDAFSFLSKTIREDGK